MAILQQLLIEPDAAMIEEWAQLANRRALRVAESTVPVLLDWWSRQPRRAEAVYAVLGARGEWLASLNEAWRKPTAGSAIPQNCDELWQTGKIADRVALLTTIRRHNPDQALALVQSTWNTDGADERRRFVEVLNEGRSMADEPFLESALDDKSKLVRRQAASVLAALPESRLWARMLERARSIIVVESKRGLAKRRVKISLTPPSSYDPSWERDGIEEQVAAGSGTRACWMRQILSVADLSVWTDLTGLTPDAVVAALRGDDYFEDALGAMICSARIARDPLWCAAIAHVLLERENLEIDSLGWLWEAVAQEQAEQLFVEIVKHKRFSPADRWTLLTAGGGRWSIQYSKAAISLLPKLTPENPAATWKIQEATDRASRLCDPAMASQFEASVSAMFPDGPPESFRKSIDRLRLRSEMHREFAQ
jgi:hypothetical protein